MPFSSKAQQRYMFAKHPDIAQEFADHTPKSAYAKLPDKKSKSRKEHMKKVSHDLMRSTIK